jgi:hypothetical protein
MLLHQAVGQQKLQGCAEHTFYVVPDSKRARDSAAAGHIPPPGPVLVAVTLRCLTQGAVSETDRH